MKRDVDGILYEALVVALVGFCAALTANHFSPKGIILTRDYFPRSEAAALDEENQKYGVQRSPEEATEARLRANDLQMVGLTEAEAMFRDPRHDSEQIIFIDARNRRNYEEGHVPGAYLLDRFLPDQTLPEVLPAAMAAETIVCYCSGDTCEDSEFSAIFLREAGVPGDRLRVYLGGMKEWREHGLLVEVGLRRSGILEGK